MARAEAPPAGGDEWEKALAPADRDEARIRELAEEQMRNRLDPRIHAPHTKWKCMKDDGVSGHPDFEQRVEWGQMPSCPVCGSPQGMPVDAAAQAGL